MCMFNHIWKQSWAVLRSRYSHLGAREPFQDLTVAGCHWRRNISFGICDMCIDKPIHIYIYAHIWKQPIRICKCKCKCICICICISMCIICVCICVCICVRVCVYVLVYQKAIYHIRSSSAHNRSLHIYIYVCISYFQRSHLKGNPKDLNACWAIPQLAHAPWLVVWIPTNSLADCASILGADNFIFSSSCRDDYNEQHPFHVA